MYVALMAMTSLLAGIDWNALPPADGLRLWLDAGNANSLDLEGMRVNTWESGAPGNVRLTGEGNQRPVLVLREAGPLRSALYFDGVDDVLRVSSLDVKTDTWTLVMVCAPFLPPKGGGLCSACPKDGNDYDPGFTVDLYQASSLFDQLSVEGAGRIGGQQDQMRREFPCGGMHVITVVRDFTEVRLFIDGRPEGTRPCTGATTIIEELRLGARRYAGAERHYFHGEIAQVLLYTRVLKEEEQKTLESLLAVGEEEQRAGEAESLRRQEEAKENRMKAPEKIESWPSTQAFINGQKTPVNLSTLPVRTDIQEAVTLGVRHMNSLFDRDRDNEPFFYANCMADGTGKMFHSVNIGIPHVAGRCLLACMMAERAAGVPFPEEGLAILERYCRYSFDNPDNLNSYFDPDKENARFIEFHNMREGLYGLWALIAGRNATWAKEKAHAMLVTLDSLTDEEGRWSLERIEQAGMKDRCFGVSVPNATRMVDPLLAYYDCTGDPLAMKLAGLYARRGLAEMFTPEGRFASMAQSSGHVHSITSSLSGITAYALNTGERDMLDACVRIMDHGVPDYFSSWGWGDEVFPEHPANEVSRGEINQTGDVIRTALLLGEAGYPRFYELAERYLRSMVLPTQHHEAELRRFLKDKEQPADDSERNVLDRTVGGYAMQLPNDRMRKGDWPLSTLDITSGAVHAMSECYRHRVDVHEGICSVNLFFDCENDHINLKSGLPFEGRLDFTMKQPVSMLRVALPPWVAPETLEATINKKTLALEINAGYILFGALNPEDTGTLRFAVPCRREKEQVDGTQYTTTWIGSQIIDILPHGEVSPLPF